MVSLFLKITGCVLIVSGASGYGFWMVSNYKERLLLLEQLRQMIFLLKGQILYANATLLEAFDTVGRRTEGPLSELFLQVSERMEGQQGESFITNVSGRRRELKYCLQHQMNFWIVCRR